MTQTLTGLAERFCCDKLFFHSYMPFYEDLFQHRQVKRLLEVGIGYEDLMKPLVPRYIHGASLRMWEEYFPEAAIFSCDIREDTLINEGRIRSVVCDQSKPLDLLSMIGNIGGNFDVIIDDGSHQLEHQIITAVTLLPFLALGGIYVIEDVGLSNTEVLARLLHGTVLKGNKRADDNLVVIRR